MTDSQVPEKGRGPWITIGDELSPEPLRVRRSWREGEIEFMGIGQTGSYPLPAGLFDDENERQLSWRTHGLVNKRWHVFALHALFGDGMLHLEVEDLGPEREDEEPDWFLRNIGGQGGRILECVICGATDYSGALVHKDGCDEIREWAGRLREAS